MQQQVLGDDLLRRHVGDADQRQHLVRAGRRRAAPTTAAACGRRRRCRRRGRGSSSSGRVSPSASGSSELASYDVGLLVRVAEVALGVVGVVEPPLGDRRAGDGGVEHVGPAQHGERGEVAAEAPARGWRPARGRARRAPRRRACSASIWSSRTAVARSRCTARSHADPRPGVPRPSATTTAKPWSANHCDVRWALWACTTRGACGPPYGSSRTGSGEPSWSSGEQHDRGQPALADRTTAGASARSERRARRTSVSSMPSSVAHCAPRLGERRRADDDRAAAGGDGVDAGLVGQRLELAVGVHRHTWSDGGVVDRVGEEHDARPVDGRDGAHLQVGRRHRLAVDEQPAGAVAVGARDERAVGRESRHAGHELDPGVVVVARQRTVGSARRRVDVEHVDARAGRADCTVMISPCVGPLHVGQVRERVAVPLDVDDRARRGGRRAG